MTIRAFAAAIALLFAGAAQAQAGKAVYEKVCAGCHAIGVIGAPKPGDAEAWKARLAKGMDAVVRMRSSERRAACRPRAGARI